jgi:3-deoxy-D-manno-octulosonic acid kinase
VVVSSGIQSVSEQIENSYIIYDARLTGQVTAHWFEPDYWQKHAEIQRIGTGRGEAWFIHSELGDYVLRHYRRGGLMARVTTDRYVWIGLHKTRAWREYQLLVTLQELGLPAPEPLAARVCRYGGFYSADLMTRRIPGSQSLSTILSRQALDNRQWQQIGRCIRRFHEHDICHADLNAHNILLDQAGRVYLIDFDKSDVDQDSSWQSRTLQRLQRSLLKLQAQLPGFHYREADWQALMAGYEA